MTLSPLIPIFIAASVSSISARNGSFCEKDGRFIICGYSNIVTYVRPTSGALHLKLNMDDISAIAPFTFDNLTLQTVRISREDLTNCSPQTIDLSPYSFAGLTLEHHLQLDCIEIPKQCDLFGIFESLPSLELRRSKFRGLSREFFRLFPHLHQLTLAELDLQTISPTTFAGISQHLNRLSIKDQVSVVDPKAFAGFDRLESLSLNNGKLADLRSDMFEGLDHLIELTLTNNKISVVRREPFSNLPQLRELGLNHNGISGIERSAFSDMSLYLLHLDDNSLTTLQIGVFNHLRHLQILYLRRNKIQSVPHNAFEGCSMLRWLHLEHNKIEHIDAAAFLGLKLQELHLEHNNLQVLKRDVFSGLLVRGGLNLRFNNMRRIRAHAFRGLKAKTVLLCWRRMTLRAADRWGATSNVMYIDSKICVNGSAVD